MRSTLATLVMLLVLAAPAGARTFRVTYLTSTTSYIDAGQDEGLAVGDRVEVVRNGAVIATLRVTDVSAHRAACTLEAVTGAIAVGDEVRFSPRARGPEASPAVVAPVAAATATSDPPVEGESFLRSIGLRGRIGVRYLGMFDQSGFGGDISQPSADIRVDGTRVAGSPIDVQVDVRARHTYQVVADGSEFDDGEARVYRLNAAWHSRGNRVCVTAGRQFSSALASVSTFDGVQVEYERERFGAGAFGGTQPEAIDYGFSTDIQEYGAFLRARAAPRAVLRWEAVVAGIGSYDQGEINREYVAVLGRLMSRTASLTLLQEIDVYRGWRQEAESTSSSLTSTFASGRVRIANDLDLDAGYDNRRDVRVYHDYVSPESAFDDSYRQGVWGGASLRLAGRYRLGAVVRSSRGGTAGDAVSYTLTGAVSRLTAANIDLRIRTTRYDNERSDGWMLTLAGGWVPDPRWALGLFTGLRDDRGKTITTPDVSTYWVGADLDVGLAQSWYWSLSGEYNGAGDDAYNQFYTGISWRF